MNRNRRTRNQIMRERIKQAITAVIMVVILIALAVWELGIWAEHPGEQPVSGRVYMATMAAE